MSEVEEDGRAVAVRLLTRAKERMTPLAVRDWLMEEIDDYLASSTSASATPINKVGAPITVSSTEPQRDPALDDPSASGPASGAVPEGTPLERFEAFYSMISPLFDDLDDKAKLRVKHHMWTTWQVAHAAAPSSKEEG